MYKDLSDILKEYIIIQSQIKNLQEKEKNLYDSLLKTNIPVSCDLGTAKIEEDYLWLLPEDYLPIIDTNELSTTLIDGRKIKLKKVTVKRLKIQLSP